MFALSSIGCVPVDGDVDEISSDNFPLLNPRIEFYAPIERAPLLLNAAEQAKIRLRNGNEGTLNASSEDVRGFNLMAEYIMNTFE